MKKVIVVILSLLVLTLLTFWVYNVLYSKPIVENNNINVEETENSDWVEYRNEAYSIYLPNNFILIKTPLAGEKENTIKVLDIHDSNYPNMHISFDFYPSESFDVENKIELKKDFLLNRNYTDKKITNQIIDEEEAWVQTGISNTKVEEGVVLEGKLNMKDILFKKGNNIFTISLQYEDKDKYLLEKFEKIISNFNFID